MTPDHLRILVVHDDIMTFTMILDVIFSAKLTLVLGTLGKFTLKSILFTSTPAMERLDQFLASKPRRWERRLVQRWAPTLQASYLCI